MRTSLIDVHVVGNAGVQCHCARGRVDCIASNRYMECNARTHAESEECRSAGVDCRFLCLARKKGVHIYLGILLTVALHLSVSS